jgi:hypothetical protein
MEDIVLYIVAIAWLYVTLLMAVAERNVVAGVMTFLLYGMGPIALVLWLFGSPRRRRSRNVERGEFGGGGETAAAPGPDSSPGGPP